MPEQLRGPLITGVETSSYVVPTDAPESDGTFAWDRTTLVVVEVSAGGMRGLGYTYADRSTATLAQDYLSGLVMGHDVFAIPALHARMVQAIRNLGRAGIAAMAISAIDVALWDAKARLLGLPLVTLLGEARAAVAAYRVNAVPDFVYFNHAAHVSRARRLRDLLRRRDLDAGGRAVGAVHHGLMPRLPPPAYRKGSAGPAARGELAKGKVLPAAAIGR